MTRPRVGRGPVALGSSGAAVIAISIAVVLVAGALALTVGCGARRADGPAARSLVPPKPGAEPGTHEVVLYFATTDAAGLAPETRTVGPPEGGASENGARDGERPEGALIEAIVRAVIAGPRSRNLFPTLPRKARLVGSELGADGVLTLDFSKELVDDMPRGETGERLAVYSVVNSVGSVEGVKAVRFTVQGEQVDSLVGFFDLDEPIGPDLTLVVR